MSNRPGIALTCATAALLLGACASAERSALEAARGAHAAPAASSSADPQPVAQALPESPARMPEMLRPLPSAPRGLEGRVFTDGSPEAADWARALDLLPPEFAALLHRYVVEHDMTVRIGRTDDVRLLIPEYVHLLSDDRKRWGTYIADETIAVALRRPDWSPDQESYTARVTLLHEAFHVIDDAGKRDDTGGYWYSQSPEVQRFVGRLPRPVHENQRAIGTKDTDLAAEILVDGAALYSLNRDLPASERAYAIGAGLTMQVGAAEPELSAAGRQVESFMGRWRRSLRPRPS